MTITIYTFQHYDPPGHSMKLVKEQTFTNIPEALRAWMTAQLDHNIDRIRIHVEKYP